MFSSPILEKFLDTAFMQDVFKKYDVVACYLGGSQLCHLDDEESDYDVDILINDKSAAYSRMYPIKFCIDGKFIHVFFNSLYWYKSSSYISNQNMCEYCSSLAKYFDFSDATCFYLNEQHKELFYKLIKNRRLLATYGSYVFHNCISKYLLSFCDGRGKLVKQACIWIYSYWHLTEQSVDYMFLKKLHRNFSKEAFEDVRWRQEVQRRMLETNGWFEAHPVDKDALVREIEQVLYA